MRRALLVTSLSLTLFVSAALPVYAANLSLLDPTFSIVPTECTACPCDYGGVLQLIQNLMNAAVSIGVIAFVLVAAYAGASMMLNPTNPEMRSKAKSMLLNVVIGMFIVLAAWLFVDFIMKTLYNESSYGPWNKILSPAAAGSWCIQPRETTVIPGLFGSIANGVVGGTNAGSGGGGFGGVGGGGSCTLPASGACSVQSLSSTCFAALGEAASRTCNLESAGGQVAILSTSDKLDRGNGRSYSVGLWQINLTTSPLRVNGIACTTAFTQRCEGNALHYAGQRLGGCDSSVVPGKERLYQDCVSAAQNGQTNTQVACSLYTQNLSAWQCSATRCAVPGARSSDPRCQAR